MKLNTEIRMRWFRRALLALFFCALIEQAAPSPAQLLLAQKQSKNDSPTQPEKIKFRLQAQPKQVVLADLPANLLARFEKLSKAGGGVARFVTVVVGDNLNPQQPAVLGACQLVAGQFVFSPRFPFETGTRYTLRVHDPAAADVLLIAAPFKLLRPESNVVAQVSAVYPSAGKLPENLLKFYIHFSQPMSRGDSYEHIKLLTADGRQIELPFLELGEELWSRDGRRFTLLFDPGRVKRGLKPREDEGAPLVAGQKYKLVIETSWLDATGKPLEKQFTKSFVVVKADYQQPHPKNWKLSPPQSASREPLSVQLPEPLDHALLEDSISVLDSAGKELDGELTIGDSEQTWQFIPHTAWSAGRYSLRIEHYLEDMAGNSVGRAFEVDLTKDQKGKNNQPAFLVFDVK